MRRDFFIHIGSWLLLFALVTILHQWFSFSYWPFWLGGLIGTALPDTDHLVYVYFLRPQELVSQRVNYLMGEKNFLKSLMLLHETRYERTGLVFHTVLFQAIFLGLTFLVFTSSGSLFGKGLVLAFYLHLFLDQIIDLKSLGSLDNWLKGIPYQPDRQKINIYLGVNTAILFLFSLFL